MNSSNQVVVANITVNKYYLDDRLIVSFMLTMTTVIVKKVLLFAF